MFTKSLLISVSVAAIAAISSPVNAEHFDRRGPHPLERRSGYDNYDYDNYDYGNYNYGNLNGYSPYGGFGGYGKYSPYGGYGFDGFDPYGYGGYGGYGGFGFPFAASFNSEFDRDTSKANFDDKTVYVNDKHANEASDKVHSKTDKDIIG